MNNLKSVKPSEDFAIKANLNASEYQKLLSDFKTDNLGTWSKLAREYLYFKEDFQETLDDSQAPYYDWFKGGKTNIAYNCLDVHLADKASKTALHFVDEFGNYEATRYQELHQLTSQAAALLEAQNIKQGDRVCIYLPNSIEAIAMMLACTRIGAIHSVVFAGFSASALALRADELEAKLIVTCDGFWRKARIIKLLETSMQALEISKTKPKILCFNRLNSYQQTTPKFKDDHKVYAKDIKQALDSISDSGLLEFVNLADYQVSLTLKWLDANDTSFVLYTSGSTGKPKGIMHRTAGYLLWAKLTCKWVLDLKDDDVYWCTADIGWITGHTYLVYGPLALGASIFLYEGAINEPHTGIWYELIEKYKISVLYTAPTAIRTLENFDHEVADISETSKSYKDSQNVTHAIKTLSKKEDVSKDDKSQLTTSLAAKFDLNSLRLLGTVGEPIAASTWNWFYRQIGSNKCPIVDTWWQTETGGHLISTIPGVNDMLPGIAGKPLPGIELAFDAYENLYISKPWAGMLKGIYKTPARFINAYYKNIEDYGYMSGDLATLVDGYVKIGGRNDDVINISGHRLGTAEIENAILKTARIVEAAVVPIKHEIKGESVVAFVVANTEEVRIDALSDYKSKVQSEVLSTIKLEIGALAKPEKIILCRALPKTRSGKIMRRLLKQITANETISGDLSTIEDQDVLKEIADSYNF